MQTKKKKKIYIYDPCRGSRASNKHRIMVTHSLQFHQDCAIIMPGVRKMGVEGLRGGCVCVCGGGGGEEREKMKKRIKSTDVPGLEPLSLKTVVPQNMFVRFSTGKEIWKIFSHTGPRPFDAFLMLYELRIFQPLKPHSMTYTGPQNATKFRVIGKIAQLVRVIGGPRFVSFPHHFTFAESVCI